MMALAALAVLTAPAQAAAPTAASAASEPHAAAPSNRRKHHRPKRPRLAKAGEWTIDGDVAIVSDYRPGGISSTAGRPALQGDVEVRHRSGLFGSVFASSLANNGGARVELDIAGGVTRKIGRLDASLLATFYVFPGVPRSAYVEGEVQISKRLGAATFGTSLAFSPPQAGTGHRSNLYLGLSADYAVPRIPLSVQADFGRENGAFGKRKLDWSVGTTLELRSVQLSLGYCDTARTFGARHSGRTFITGVSVSF